MINACKLGIVENIEDLVIFIQESEPPDFFQVNAILAHLKKLQEDVKKRKNLENHNQYRNNSTVIA